MCINQHTITDYNTQSLTVYTITDWSFNLNILLEKRAVHKWVIVCGKNGYFLLKICIMFWETRESKSKFWYHLWTKLSGFRTIMMIGGPKSRKKGLSKELQSQFFPMLFYGMTLHVRLIHDLTQLEGSGGFTLWKQSYQLYEITYYFPSLQHLW